MKNNIFNKQKTVFKYKECYGCGICVISCPKHIIEIIQNKDGFYVPTITQKEECINCGKCLSVCSFHHNHKIIVQNDALHSPKYYSCWSLDENVRLKCTSGGIAFEITSQLLNKGYKVCAVRYNVDKKRAEHYLAYNQIDLRQSIGSKYMPSYTVDALKLISFEQPCVVVGTPCYVDSLRRYARKNNIENKLVLIDFFCHGTPSLNLSVKYLRYLESLYGKTIHVGFRTKFNHWFDPWSKDYNTYEPQNRIDWHDSVTTVFHGEKGNFVPETHSRNNIFFQFFLGCYCLNKPCYDNCIYKQLNSAADLRVGDLWGNKYQSNTDGVSGLIVFTEKGNEIIKQITNCHLEREKSNVILDGQWTKAVLRSKTYLLTKWLLRTSLSISTIASVVFTIEHFPRKYKKRIKKLFYMGKDYVLSVLLHK